ncbi:protein-serine O-palmitoleoyltransferase porcupine-like [Apostichopus japonicus]|uniref:protein-serine O-palmitoleoyltransferase porcupine-like n=1 Tax=Stichopus japonicus TaxID=307972 RepID=UPI003AB89A87
MDLDFGDYDAPDYFTEDMIPEDMDLSDLDLSNIPEDVLEQLMAKYFQNNYETYDYESDPQPVDISYVEHFKDCGLPTLQQAIQIIGPLLLLSVCVKLSAVTGFPKVLVHLLSTATGLVSLYLFFHTSLHFLITFSILGYSLLFLLDQTNYQRKGAACAVMCLLYLLTLELFVAEPTEWHKVRGSQMILAMKIISMGFDLDTGQIPSLPGPVEYQGYCFCVGSVIFGPWTSYNSYLEVVQSSSLNWRWLFSGIFAVFLSLICLLLSTCVSSILFMTTEYKWLQAYRDAFSFRTSHYFVSYASEATAILVGFGETRSDDKITWNIPVARPWRVEIPRSLGEVVVSWNLPMHHWLKAYVFKISRPLGQFPAVLLTFMASAMLHGLNFQLAAVLISLAFISYIEFGLRKKLADAFSACILARSCKPECVHNYRTFHPIVLLMNLVFGLLTIFHLAYLGVMFDTDSSLQEEGYDMSHTLNKWSELDYASHYVALVTFLCYWLI